MEDENKALLDKELISISETLSKKRYTYLQNKLEELTLQGEELEKEILNQKNQKSTLEYEREYPSDVIDNISVSNNISFFDQMRSFELAEAYLNGLYKAKQKIQKQLSDEIHLQELRNERLSKSIEKLTDQLNHPITPNSKGINDILMIQNEIKVISDEYSDAQKEVDTLKNEVKTRSEQLQSIDESDIPKLSSQIATLDQMIADKTARYKQVLLEEKKLNSSEDVLALRDHKYLEQILNDESWEAERNILLSLISHAKSDIKYVKNQIKYEIEPRSNATSRMSSLSDIRRSAKRRTEDSRTSSRTSSRLSQTNNNTKEDSNFNEETLIAALQAEVDELESDDHPINVAMRIEKEIAKKLDEEFEELDKRIELISKNGKTKEIMNDEEEQRRQQKLKCLKSELQNLMEKNGIPQNKN
ncbi:hypothetical protein GPJ56_007282 [Histomonas meleagridis]|uniref:uncharacterized protein n=1 Tax=Histomonas meleagridis TaxID=135588 RepID=UPI00355A8561|nr:hypothetical protein GPJ56_007282 [Histomonas meleagridis]KAH0804128.1 hypothetical protein GO595_002958 [Histomonas meleagridis]